MRTCGIGNLVRRQGFQARIFLAVLAATAALALFGASGCKEPKARLGNGVLATVDGQPVTVEDFRLANDGDIPKKYEDRESALKEFVNSRLVAKVALAEGYIAHPEVKSRMEMLYARHMPLLLEKELAKGISVSDEELLKYKSPDVPVFEVDIIVTSALDQAESALAEVRKGAKFEDVAVKRSTLKHQFGEKVRLDDDLYPPGVRAVFNGLKPGQLSPVMKTDIGYMVARLKSRGDTGQDWEKDKEIVRKDLKARKVRDAVSVLTEQLMAKAYVKVNDGLFKPGGDHSWAAVVDGVTIAPDPAFFGEEGSPHKPHMGMRESSLMATLNKWVAYALLSREARRRGLDKDPEFQKLLKVKTEEILAEVYIGNIRGDYAVTDKDVQEYYAKNKEKLATPKGMRISRILSRTKDDAQAALKELKKGRDFAAVARERSVDDSSKDEGGDVGYVEFETLREPLKGAVSKLKVGDVSPVVQSDYGFEVLKLTDIKEPVVPELAEVTETIKKRVLLVKQSERVEQFYKELLEKADVKMDEALLRSL